LGRLSDGQSKRKSQRHARMGRQLWLHRLTYLGFVMMPPLHNALLVVEDLGQHARQKALEDKLVWNVFLPVAIDAGICENITFKGKEGKEKSVFAIKMPLPQHWTAAIGSLLAGLVIHFTLRWTNTLFDNSSLKHERRLPSGELLDNRVRNPPHAE
jgi:hypothetical protein